MAGEWLVLVWVVAVLKVCVSMTGRSVRAGPSGGAGGSARVEAIVLFAYFIWHMDMDMALQHL